MYTVTCVGGTNETPNPCNPGASVTVKIVDRCPSPGCQATLDLSQQAFAIIGNLGAGKIVIDYSQYVRMQRNYLKLLICFFLVLSDRI
jgi:rare lipoprotein A (peptidoglycan hydrolase)